MTLIYMSVSEFIEPNDLTTSKKGDFNGKRRNSKRSR